MKESANPKKPLLVYGDWALQDWDDGPMLSEALTLANLETLRGWKERHGVAFDYYIIDARWYAPDSLLRFDPEHWPRGFAEARRAMEALGTRVGLWYCISRSLVKDPRWSPSLTDSGGQYSLSHGPYLEGLEEALEHAYAEFGLRMVKWDFAEFAAKAREQPESDRASLRAANIGAFNRMVDRFRARHPETLQLAYNGFAHVPGAIDHTSPTLIPSIDPKFLDHFDWLYSGDPRPADVPMTSFWRAVDVYQDHQVRRWHASGYPLDR
ncbi:MAG TPA: hypothetical protein VGJ84_15810, partial [Polyangiaceae bacterium]